MGDGRDEETQLSAELHQARIAELKIERAERRAFRRVDLGLSLSYGDLEIVTGVPKATLRDWRSGGKLDPLPSSYGNPRFALRDVLRIIGDPTRGDAHMGSTARRTGPKAVERDEDPDAVLARVLSEIDDANTKDG